MQTDKLQEARIDRDKRDGTRPGATISHANGNCALEFGLCSACYEDLLHEQRAWAFEQPAPMAGEDAGDYWKRIGGRFWDTWHEVATDRIRGAA